MTVNAHYFSETFFAAVTDTSNDYQINDSVSDKRFSFIITSDVAFHLHRTEGGAESATAATTEDMRIPAATPFKVSGFAGDWYSLSRATAKTTEQCG
jgi:hypothetical protein